jgi:hypothetical protein
MFTNNALLHPWRALSLALRRILVNRDMNDPMWDGGVIPPGLLQFGVGESLPWKGVRFKVGKVVGGDFPCIILVPVGYSHGTHVRAAKRYVREAEGEQRADDLAQSALASGYSSRRG